MSKKHGARKKRRRKNKKRTPAALLGNLAEALNACERKGVKIRLRHGAVWSYYGVIVPPPPGKKGQWEARPFRHNHLSPGEDHDLDHEDD
jgi:hypothetical protein